MNPHQVSNSYRTELILVWVYLNQIFNLNECKVGMIRIENSVYINPS